MKWITITVWPSLCWFLLLETSDVINLNKQQTVNWMQMKFNKVQSFNLISVSLNVILNTGISTDFNRSSSSWFAENLTQFCLLDLMFLRNLWFLTYWTFWDSWAIKLKTFCIKKYLVGPKFFSRAFKVFKIQENKTKIFKTTKIPLKFKKYIFRTQ